MVGYVLFLIVHVAMVIMTGTIRNMNHITQGTDSATDYTGLFIVTGILFL
jgi:hypothetical protein